VWLAPARGESSGVSDGRSPATTRKFDFSHTDCHAKKTERQIVLTRIKRKKRTSEIMDQYKASVQGVDDALARLNATLASYKISGNLPKKHGAEPVAESPIASEHSSTSTAQVPDEVRGTLKHHVYQVVSKVIDEPVDWHTWNDMSDGEADQKYPEVSTVV